MIIENINHLMEHLGANKKILALDVSKNNLGVAISDSLLCLAFAKPTIIRTSLSKDLTTLQKYVTANNIGIIVIGLPLSRDGSTNTRVQSIKTFASILLKNINLPLYYQDERYSTIAIENNPYTSKQDTDSQSAMWFLQIVLDKINMLKKNNQKLEKNSNI